MEISLALDRTETRAGARVRILEAFDAYVAAVAAVGGLPSRERFMRRYNAGEVDVEPWVRETYPQLTKITFRRWFNSRLRHGDKGLVPKYGQRLGKGKIKLSIEADASLRALLKSAPNITVRAAFAALGREFPTMDVSMTTVRRYLKSIREENPEATELARVRALLKEKGNSPHLSHEIAWRLRIDEKTAARLISEVLAGQSRKRRK